MRISKVLIVVAILLTAVPADRARADFLGLAPGDYVITLQQEGIHGPTRLDGLTGTVHIPSGPVTVSNFSWYFTLRDIIGPLLFEWTGELLLVQSPDPDGGSYAYEEAIGPGRVCEGDGTLCYPRFELFYAPNRNLGPCNEGSCSQFFQDNFSYIVLQRGGWSAERIIGEVGEPSPFWLLLMGAALIAVSKCRYL